MEEETLSIRTVTILITLLGAFLGWCVLANSYSFAHPTPEIENMQDAGKVAFFLVGFGQIPNFFKAIIWHFSNRQWALVLAVVLVLIPLWIGRKLVQIAREDAALQRRKNSWK